MDNELIYCERVSSNRTEALFVALTLLFFALLVGRVNAGGLDILAAVILCLCTFFFFYAVNYRTLVIAISSQALQLTFGIFRWKVPLDNIESCGLDEVPLLMRMGGAGIHFMLIRQRYRASFNFLEHPRVVVRLRRKIWLVQDISFSTRRPDDVLRILGDRLLGAAMAAVVYGPAPDLEETDNAV